MVIGCQLLVVSKEVVVYHYLFSKERAAWNEVESGSTGEYSQPSTPLTEPQGKLKKCG